MTKPPLIVGLLAAAAVASCATSADMATREPSGAEATILFASRNGIRDFEAVTDQTVYLRASDNKWYRATLFSPCIGLDHKATVAYDTNPDGSFDRMSALRVNGHRCQVQSLVESGPPPSRKSG